jgi:hypothetical protein
MNFRGIRWGRVLLGFLIAEVVLIAAAFAWVAVYSYFINTGHPNEFYEAYAQRSSPWVSLVVGIPVFFLVGRWVARKSPGAEIVSAVALFGICFLLDCALMLAGDNPALTPLFLAINYPAKLLACYWGARKA